MAQFLSRSERVRSDICKASHNHEIRQNRNRVSTSVLVYTRGQSTESFTLRHFYKFLKTVENNHFRMVPVQ